MTASRSRRARLFDWLYRIRTRLLLVNVLIVAVPLVGLGFARLYEREMLRALEDDMVHQGQVLRAALLADPTGLRLSERQALLVTAARETRARIRLLGPDLRVWADSHADGPPEGPERPPPRLLPGEAPSARVATEPPGPVDLTDRRELVLARRGQYGAATRVWERGRRVYLFSALPIEQGGQVTGIVYLTRSTYPVLAALYRLRTSLLQVLAAAVAATAVLTLLFAATISRPLTRLTRIARRIAAGDRTDANVWGALALRRRDEIGDLARAFDQMARELDERARYVAELAANISHEFKSPLTSLRGAAELLLDGAADDPRARTRFLENMLADAHRLDRLVTRLLELSRVEADLAPVEVLDLEALTREAARQAPGAAPVRVTWAAGATLVPGRRAHLAALLANLVDNAQQHAARDTEVSVHVADVSGGLRLDVTNQGPPISAANLPRVWDRFFTTRAGQGGTGLGLPIVRAVAEAHGGTVAVTSGDGATTFSVQLPAARA